MVRNKPGRLKQIRGPVSDKVLLPVDADAVKGYWNGLSTDEKLHILQFDDPALVNRVYSVQQELYAADQQCYNLGLRGQDAERERVGMNQFAMECDIRACRPVVFFAQQTFVERTDFSEYSEQLLGRPFLKVPQGMQRKEWCETLQPNASSWQDFMVQILRLVEFAILHAYYDTKSTQCDKAEDENTLAPAEEVVEQPTPSAKRRARKNKNKSKSILDSMEEMSVESSSGRHAVADDEVDVNACGSTDPLLEEESCLKFDWCGEGPPIDDRMESAVELQVDWSVDGPHPTETWSAWLPNGLNGRCAQWHWVENHGVSQRAFLKNTFVETMDSLPEDNRSRTRSLPARPRPAEL